MNGRLVDRRDATPGPSAPACWMIGVLLLVVAPAMPPVRAQTVPAGGQASSQTDALAEARKLYELQEFDRALPALDAIVSRLEADTGLKPSDVPVLVTALELRALARLKVRLDWEGATADFKALLARDPRHTLAATMSPKILAKFEEAKRATVGTVIITVLPKGAETEIDGQPVVLTPDPVPMAAGTHSIRVWRPGYAPVKKEFQVLASTTGQAVDVTLPRTSAILRVLTSPPDVEVWVDNVLSGATKPGPIPPEYSREFPDPLLPPNNTVGILAIEGISPGLHPIEFRKNCYAVGRTEVPIGEPRDYGIAPRVMAPAVASVRVDADTGGLSVYLDNEPKGVLPIMLDQVCEGPHTLEVRSNSGRFVKRLKLAAGDTVNITANLRPYYAVLTATGGDSGVRGSIDPRTRVEQLLGEIGSVGLFVEAKAVVQQHLGRLQLDEGWLDFDLNLNPVPAGGAAAKYAPPARILLSTQLSAALGVQGVATVTRVPDGSPDKIYVSLLAAGSSRPDVLEVDLNDQDSLRDVRDQLTYVPALTKPSVAMLVIDVLDREGAVVAGVDAGGAAASAGLAVGDIIVRANQQPVKNGTEFVQLVTASRDGQTLSLEVTRGSETKAIQLPVTMTPRMVSPHDRTVLFNKLLLDYRMKGIRAQSPLERATALLNVGVAFLALENIDEARRALEQVKFQPGPGISAATVQYLLGMCAEKSGEYAEAERLWKAAAQSPGSLLTEDGPLIKDLAEEAMKRLQGGGRRNQDAPDVR